MTKNPILDELRETRERLLAEAGGTLDALVAQLQRDERRSDREFVRPKSRTVLWPLKSSRRTANAADFFESFSLSAL